MDVIGVNNVRRLHIEIIETFCIEVIFQFPTLFSIITHRAVLFHTYLLRLE